MKDLSNKVKKTIRKLSKKKYRRKKGLILIEGVNSVTRAFKNDLKLKYFIVNKNSIDTLNDFDIKDYNKVYRAEYGELKTLSNMQTPYKMMAIFEYPEKKMYENKNILYLQHIQDPGNLGTLIRSAVAFNFPNIILSKKCVNPYSEKVIRSSSGYIFDSFIEKKDIDFEFYKEKGYTICSTFTDKKSINNEKLISNKPIFLILGNEGRGISEDVLRYVDYNIKVKVEKKVESLNVAIAGSIIMHKFYEG